MPRSLANWPQTYARNGRPRALDGIGGGVVAQHDHVEVVGLDDGSLSDFLQRVEIGFVVAILFGGRTFGARVEGAIALLHQIADAHDV